MNESMLPDLKHYLTSELGVRVEDATINSRHTIMWRGPESSASFVSAPETTEQFEATVKAHIKYNIPFALIAGGTGLAGAQRAQGEPYIDIRLLNQLEKLTFKDKSEFKFSKVDRKLNDVEQADKWRDELSSYIAKKGLSSEEEIDRFFEGVKFKGQAAVGIGTVNHVLAPAGVFLPFDAGSNKIGNATLGGITALYSAGADVGSFGAPADSTTYVRSISGNGKVFDETGLNGNKRDRKDNEPFLTRDKLLFGDSAIGSEGTFKLITDVEFVATQIPKQRHVLMLKFDSKEDVMSFRESLTQQFGEQHIRQFEIMNDEAVKMVKDKKPDVYSKVFGSNDVSNYYVMIDIMDKQKFDPENNIGMKVYEHISSLGKQDGIDFFAYGDLTKMSADKDAAPTAPISIPHELRHTMSEVSKGIAVEYAVSSGSKNSAGNPNDYKHMLTFDVCTPKNTYVKCLQEIEDLFEKEFGKKPKVYGHGVVYAGHIHFHSEKDLDSEYKEGKSLRGYLTEKVYAILMANGASCSSEHGIGQLYAQAWMQNAEHEYVSRWVATKLKHDPNNLFHPRSNGMDVMIDRLKTDNAFRSQVVAACGYLSYDDLREQLLIQGNKLDRSGQTQQKG